jgi:hypothetical protein
MRTDSGGEPRTIPVPRPTAPLLLGLLLGGLALAFLVAHLIVTDAEAIEALVAEAERAVEAQEFAAFRAVLAEDYEGEGGDADGAVEAVEQAWRQHEPTGIRTEVLGLEVHGDEAVSRVQVDAGVYGRVTRLLLDVTYVRAIDGWKIRRVALVESRRRRHRGPKPR